MEATVSGSTVRPSVIDSPYRCPHCGKRMIRDEIPTKAYGEAYAVDTCWNCDYAVTRIFGDPVSEAN